MRTIVMSDTAIIGSDIADLEEGYKLLTELQHKGIKLIWLSNRPEYCMRVIGARVFEGGKTKYEYLGTKVNRGEGINLISHGEGVELVSRTIYPDFTIFGNGICTFDRNEELIRQEEFLKKSTVDAMTDCLERCGYKSIDSSKRDGLGDRCIQNGEYFYKYFTPENGVAEPTNRVYGMQCSGSNHMYEHNTIEAMSVRVPEMKAYMLNNKICFYHQDINKLVALEKLLDHEDMNIDDCVLILSELTDDVLLSEYPKISEKVKGELAPKSKKTLAKVLREIS